jgi:hypothetical protein
MNIRGRSGRGGDNQGNNLKKENHCGFEDIAYNGY